MRADEKPWTDDEVAYLIKAWNGSLLYVDEIGAHLGRSEGSVRGKIRTLRRSGISMVDRQSRSRFRGRMSIPKHVHPVVAKLFREMNQQRTTLGEVAERSGLSVTCLSDWRYRKMPTVANLDAAFNALGLTLTVRPL